MKCSICGKDVNAAVRPAGSDKLYCAACQRDYIQSRRKAHQDKCLVCGRFEKCETKRITAVKFLTERGLARKQRDVKEGRLRCVECKVRESYEDKWQAAEFPEKEVKS